ncbi:hypothetical protein MMC11_007268 [Xylographa trunciseda]|nr:hypothetical protein [Xylographa trunciseda]
MPLWRPQSFRVIHRGAPGPRGYYYDDPPSGEGLDFHDLYPSSPQAYLSQCGLPLTYDASSDRVMNLPKEIKDQILTYLGVMDLDAIRCTSKSWWICIMTDVWLLRTVLLSPNNPCNPRRSPSGPELDASAELRFLAIRFDDSAKELHHSNEDHSWKQSFREVDVDFGSSSSLPLGKQTVEWVSYWSPIRVVILLVKVNSDLHGDVSTTGEKKRIIFYSLDSGGRPVHLGTVSCPDHVTELEVVGLGGNRLSRSFHHPIILRSHCHTWFRHCRVEQRASFLYTESPLKLTVVPLDHTQPAPVQSYSLASEAEHVTTADPYALRPQRWRVIRAGGVSGHDRSSCYRLQMAMAKQDHYKDRIMEDRVTGKWIVLNEPSQIEPFLIDFHPNTNIEGLIVAKHNNSQKLYLVGVHRAAAVRPAQGEKLYTIKPKIYIPAPKEGMVFRNLSFCYDQEQSWPEKFRMVINWVHPSSPSSPGELYLYKVTAAEPPWLLRAQTLRQMRLLTLPPGIGGLHKESPLRQFQQPLWSSTDHTDGGIVLNPKLNPDAGFESQTRTIPDAFTFTYRESGFQVVVSGVSKEDGKAYLRILDLSPHFDDPWGSTLIDSTLPNGSRLTLSNLTHNETYKRQTCMCAMHDLSYSVSLPEEVTDASDILENTKLQSMDEFKLIRNEHSGERPIVFAGFSHARDWNKALDSNKALEDVKLSQLRERVKDMLNGPSSLSWTNPSEIFSQSVDKGTVSQYTSPHRAAGVERLRKRGQVFIQKMRDDDLPDEQIANCWFNARWSWWNLMTKPDGWRRAAWQG